MNAGKQKNSEKNNEANGLECDAMHHGMANTSFLTE